MTTSLQSGRTLGNHKTISILGPLSVCALIALTLAAVPGARTQSPPLDEQAIQTLLDEVDNKVKESNAKQRHYSYKLTRTEQDLNDQGESTKTRVHEYLVFSRGRGQVVMAMLSEDGKALSPEKLAKEKARANKEWQKHKNDRLPDLTKAASWFESLDFTAQRSERVDEKEVIVLSFTPKANYSGPKDSKTLMPDLKGELWIDPKEKGVLKFQAELTRERGLSGWLSSLKPGTTITIENMQLPNGIWVMKRLESSSITKGPGVLLLPRTGRFRNVDEMTDYREFDPDATDLFK
jgi:hypothetical protein